MRKSEISAYLLERNPHLTDDELQPLVKTLDQVIKTYLDLRTWRSWMATRIEEVGGKGSQLALSHLN